jgi:hypothetical protein
MLLQDVLMKLAALFSRQNSEAVTASKISK